MRAYPAAANGGIDPETFAIEIDEFREALADPTNTTEDLERALHRIVAHASLLDPAAAGFADAGMSLKAALCAWLDAAPLRAHEDTGDGH